MYFDQQRRQKLIERFITGLPNLDSLTDAELMGKINIFLASQSELHSLGLQDRKDLAAQLFNSFRGFDILQPLLDDPKVTEVMVNGPRQIYYEQAGKLHKTSVVFDDRHHLTQVICRFFGRANKLINEQKPIASMRLSDGSRVHAVLQPAAPDGPSLTIRRFTGIRPSLDALVDEGSLSQAAVEFLDRAVKSKQNIFISGGTGTGKTTFLNALSGHIPSDERIITIEDALELDLRSLPNLVRLEAQAPGPDGQGAVSLKDLIKSSLRMRPDRIIVGEVRGEEAFDMVQAMSTGHPGSMSTGHGNSCQEMLERICLLILISSNLPWEAVRRLVSTALDLIIHLARLSDGRRVVKEIVKVHDYQAGQFKLEPLFTWQGTSLDPA